MSRASPFCNADVEKAVKSLLIEGSRVTADRIQRHLGGGSLPWIEKACAELNINLTGLELPENVRSIDIQALNALSPMIDEFRADAQKDLEAEVDAHENTRKQLTEELELLTRSRKRTEERVIGLKSQLEAMEGLLAEEKMARTEAETRIHALETDLKSATILIEKRTNELNNKKQSLKIYFESWNNIETAHYDELQKTRQEYMSHITQEISQIRKMQKNLAEREYDLAQLKHEHSVLTSENLKLKMRQ